MAVRPPPCLSMWQENKLRSLCTEKTGLKKIIRKQGCVHCVLGVGVIIAWLRLHVWKQIGYKTRVLWYKNTYNWFSFLLVFSI